MSDEQTSGGAPGGATGPIINPGRADWRAPGTSQVASGGGPVNYGAPTWSPPPGTGPVPGPVPGRPQNGRPPAQGWLVATIVIGLVGTVLVLGWIAVAFAQRAQRADEVLGPYSSDVYPTTTFVAGFPQDDPAPPVVAPPADAETATPEIAALFVRVFAPNQSPELWDANFTDATGLSEVMAQFTTGSCAPGTSAVVTGVQFTGDDRANVEFRFEGPNVPEYGRTYIFHGVAEREPGGPWKSTPDAVHEVANLAGGYCN